MNDTNDTIEPLNMTEDKTRGFTTEIFNETYGKNLLCMKQFGCCEMI